MDAGEIIGTIIGVVIAVVILGVFFGGFGSDSGGSDNPLSSITQSPDAKKANLYSDAIEPDDPAVRAYALNAIKSNHGGNYNIAQICDIYDRLYRDWVYVNDPNGINYVAPASESVRLLKGDCDDYAVLMASLIESIGGGSRVICAWNGNTGHAYAEVYMANSDSSVQKLIDNMANRYNDGGYFYYHEDYEDNGGSKYWLNLDWTAKRPGGKFYSHTGDILAIYPNGYYERIDDG